ncbi:MAG: IspD/TarI family cytidylyltransferase [Candidatus Omnitrophota bacterium]|nr:IspD/TarI family cytidylyltransferase [Candidatus Omnitrophota bacterium]
MSCSAIILTGGSGSRIKELESPKQFYELLGKAVFIHTIEIYENIEEIDDIYLVINQNYAQKYNEILERYSFKKLRKLVPGGLTRQDSVENGVMAIDKADIVVIQDGASPTTPPELIKNCINAAKKYGACTAYLAARHTVVSMINNEIETVLERDSLAYTCAPQAYKFEIIVKALEYAKENTLTNRPIVDLVKRIGSKVALVPSIYENIKITTYENLPAVEQVLKNRIKKQIKIGAVNG